MNHPMADPRDRRGGKASRGIRWIVVAGVVAIAVVAWLTIAGHQSPARPPGLAGKLDYHGTATVHDGSVRTVILGDHSFSPTYLRGPAGARFVVHLQAEGFHAHSFTVPSLGIDVTVAPGAVADVPVTIPDGPATVFYCRFHQSKGMQGAIIVPGADRSTG